MNPPSVLILGASGFIGRAIQRQLSNEYQLITADLQPNVYSDVSSSEHHIIDQGDPKDVKRLLSAPFTSLRHTKRHGGVCLDLDCRGSRGPFSKC